LIASRTPAGPAAPAFTPVNRADKLVAALLGYRAGSDLDPIAADDVRRVSRERIVLMHSVLARRRHRRLGAVSGRRLP
jgi:hypothetical protein